jgi:putative endonuclease
MTRVVVVIPGRPRSCAGEPGISGCFAPSRYGTVPIMSYYVYMMASKKNGVLYIGITNDLVRRVYEHKTGPVHSFTSRYNVSSLVWFEIYDDPLRAIGREKELKKWRRNWKIKLIEANNIEWHDLYASIV